MYKDWLIFLRGTLVARKLTKKGAESLAFQLAKEKGWKIEEISVRKASFSV